MKSWVVLKSAKYFTVTPASELFSIAWTYIAKDYENISDEERWNLLTSHIQSGKSFECTQALSNAFTITAPAIT